MKRGTTLGKLPTAQRNNIQAFLEVAQEIEKTTASSHRAYDRRHRLMLRIFDEIDKQPSHYFHSQPDNASDPKLVPMTPEMASQLRHRYLETLRPLRFLIRFVGQLHGAGKILRARLRKASSRIGQGRKRLSCCRVRAI